MKTNAELQNEKNMIVEVCPHCETEIYMEWDVEWFGYEATCPVCGQKMMLCDECCHEVTDDNPDGECVVDCDWCVNGGCRRSRVLSVRRKIELFDNLVNHITELVSGCDLTSTLRCIGFTDAEILAIKNETEWDDLEDEDED